MEVLPLRRVGTSWSSEIAIPEAVVADASDFVESAESVFTGPARKIVSEEATRRIAIKYSSGCPDFFEAVLAPFSFDDFIFVWCEDCGLPSAEL